MKGERLLHALGEVDEEYLAQVDALRRVPAPKKRHTWIPMAACLCLVVGAVALALRGGIEMPSGSSSQSNSSASAGGAQTQGVYVPPLEVGGPEWEQTNEDVGDFFIYQGRAYSQIGTVEQGEALVGAQLGVSSGSFDQWTAEEQFLEGTGSAEGPFYEVKGYDPKYLLCMEQVGGVELYWNNYDITVSTGGDVLEQVFRLSDGIAQAQVREVSTTGQTTQLTQLDQLEQWVDALCQAPALSSAETDLGQCSGNLDLTKADGVTVHLRLMGNGYVQVEHLPQVCWQMEWQSIMP